MVFSSFTFLFWFLPIFFICYLTIPNKYKNLCLFIFSLLFYAWGEPIYVLLMLFSTLNDFIFGNLIYKNLDNKKSKLFLIISIIINLSLLGFFKYSNFLIDTINQILNSNINNLELALPIGISFYTFQTMSYSIDIYRKRCKPQKNIIDFGTYVTLFPQLIAGPIVTYNQIEKELTNRKMNLNEGLYIFIIGLSKKVLLANNMGILWEQCMTLNSSILNNWIGIICYAFQIYFDFSGYSDMAIGLGKMLGFEFPKNFNYPYISKSITEFWRRWHISLSSWFKDYVYIPLGGNKKGLLLQIRNILIVWLLTGFWHGASWNFVIWGLYFGFILILEKMFLLKLLNKIPKVFQHLYSLFLICIGWTIFAIEDINQILIYLKGMFINNIIDVQTLELLFNNKILFLICILSSIPLLKKINKGKYVIATLLFIICITFLIGSSYNPFLYFRF